MSYVPTEFYRQLGANLSHYRQAAGHSLWTLAGLLMIPVSQLESWENGAQPIPLDVCAVVAEQLSVEIDILIEECPLYG